MTMDQIVKWDPARSANSCEEKLTNMEKSRRDKPGMTIDQIANWDPNRSGRLHDGKVDPRKREKKEKVDQDNRSESSPWKLDFRKREKEEKLYQDNRSRRLPDGNSDSLKEKVDQNNRSGSSQDVKLYSYKSENPGSPSIIKEEIFDSPHRLEKWDKPEKIDYVVSRGPHQAVTSAESKLDYRSISDSPEELKSEFRGPIKRDKRDRSPHRSAGSPEGKLDSRIE